MPNYKPQLPTPEGCQTTHGQVGNDYVYVVYPQEFKYSPNLGDSTLTFNASNQVTQNREFLKEAASLGENLKKNGLEIKILIATDKDGEINVSALTKSDLVLDSEGKFPNGQIKINPEVLNQMTPQPVTPDTPPPLSPESHSPGSTGSREGGADVAGNAMKRALEAFNLNTNSSATSNPASSSTRPPQRR